MMDDTPTTDAVDTVRSLQEAGFWLVSCIEKAPISGKGWNSPQVYEHNQDRIADHVARGGQAGIIMAEGLMVFDADSAEADAWAEAFLPETPMMTKTKKGTHRYYRRGYGIADKTYNFAGLADIKLNGQCIAFGPFKVENDEPLGSYSLAYDGETLADLPEFTTYHLDAALDRFVVQKPSDSFIFRDDIEAEEDTKDLVWQMMKGERKFGEGVKDGGRNVALNSLVFQAAKRGATPAQVIAMAREFCANCTPPYTDELAMHQTAESAWNAGHALYIEAGVVEQTQAEAAPRVKGAYTWDDVVAVPEVLTDYDWVVPGLIETGLSAIGAYAGAGKSYTMGALAAHVAGILPESMIDPRLTPKFPRNVIIVSEAPMQLMRMYMVMAKRYGLDYARDFAPRIKLIQARRQIAQHLQDNAELFSTFTLDSIFEDVIVTKTPWIIYDTSSATVATEDENANSEWSKVASVIKNSYGDMPVTFVCHVAKTQKNSSDGSQMSMRGAGSIEGDANQTFYLTIDETTKERRLDFSAGKVRFTLEHDYIAVDTSTESLAFIDEAGDVTVRDLMFPILTAKSRSEVQAQKKEISDALEREKVLKEERNLSLICEAIEKHQNSTNLAPLGVSQLRDHMAAFYQMHSAKMIDKRIDELVGRGIVSKKPLSKEERDAFNEQRSQQISHQTQTILTVKADWVDHVDA